MELPTDVQSIIHNYSLPLTRPDWRTMRRMPTLRYHIAIANEAWRRGRKNKVVYELFCDLYVSQRLCY